MNSLVLSYSPLNNQIKHLPTYDIERHPLMDRSERKGPPSAEEKSVQRHPGANL